MGEGVLMVIMDTCLQGDEEKYSQQGLVLWLKKRRRKMFMNDHTKYIIINLYPNLMLDFY